MILSYKDQNVQIVNKHNLINIYVLMHYKDYVHWYYHINISIKNFINNGI
jgi:hypothetical protein